jgi:glycosyltransferase involved in cell wall biosynthesis
VSVLLPVWNAAGTLPACLRSLARQTLRDHEVVAVDDGSSDQTRAILSAHARRDPRLRLLARPHAGLVGALNAGLNEARAPLVARMDADDVAHPERLARQAAVFEQGPPGLVLGTRVRSTGSAPGTGMLAYVAWSNGLLDHAAITRDMLVESPLVHPSVMLETAVLRRLGGYRDDACPEDYDLWLRAQAAGLRFHKLPERLLDWRDRPDRLTRTDPRYAPARFLRRKAEALVGRGIASRGAVIWGAGDIGKAWARELLGRGVAVKAFAEVAPRRLGQRIHGAPVLDVDAAARLVGPLHLLAVGQPGARRRLREETRRRGLVEGDDVVAVA